MNDRLARIGARARHMAYLDALSTEGASMARAPNEDDLAHAKERFCESGARWAARSRGII